MVNGRDPKQCAVEMKACHPLPVDPESPICNLFRPQLHFVRLWQRAHRPVGEMKVPCKEQRVNRSEEVIQRVAKIGVCLHLGLVQEHLYATGK